MKWALSLYNYIIIRLSYRYSSIGQNDAQNHTFVYKLENEEPNLEVYFRFKCLCIKSLNRVVKQNKTKNTHRRVLHHLFDTTVGQHCASNWMMHPSLDGRLVRWDWIKINPSIE